MEIKRNWLERAVQFTQTKAQGLTDFYHDRAHGPLSRLVRIIKATALWYKRRIWDRYTVNEDEKRTPKRVAATVFATLLALYLIPTALHATWQGGLMALTWRDEIVYLNAAEEVDPDGDVHSIRGCREIPCRESDSIYFRVRPTWMHDVYALITRGTVFYPDYVASVVAPGVNRCEVVSYGIRVRALMRGWDIFPDMLDAVCTPYDASKVTAAIPAE
jgi:hypothetical protein